MSETNNVELVKKENTKQIFEINQKDCIYRCVLELIADLETGDFKWATTQIITIVKGESEERRYTTTFEYMNINRTRHLPLLSILTEDGSGNYRSAIIVQTMEGNGQNGINNFALPYAYKGLNLIEMVKCNGLQFGFREGDWIANSSITKFSEADIDYALMHPKCTTNFIDIALVFESVLNIEEKDKTKKVGGNSGGEFPGGTVYHCYDR